MKSVHSCSNLPSTAKEANEDELSLWEFFLFSTASISFSAELTSPVFVHAELFVLLETRGERKQYIKYIYFN